MINWLISHSDYIVMEDGTIEFTYKDQLSYTHINSIEKSAKVINVLPSGIVLSGEGETFSWSAKFSKGNINFQYHDYTIPMNTK